MHSCSSPPRTAAAEPAALPRSTPEAQGVPSAAILGFVEAAEKNVDALHSLMVLRHGHVVAEGWWGPYRRDDPHVLFSLSKSFASTGIGLAIAEGKLSLDDTVLTFFPEDAPAEPSENLKAMRVRDLLAMSTGHHADVIEPFPYMDPAVSQTRAFLALPVAHKPGTHFVYNTPASYMLSAIVQKVSGTPLVDYLRPRLFEPLGIRNPKWDATPKGVTLGGFGLSVTHRGHRAVRPALPAEGRVGRQAPPAGRVGGGRHRAPGLERQQPGERLGPGLRLPVLALPPRRLPRRRGLRPVLHRDARAGRGHRDHERRARHAGRPEPRLGAPPARDEGVGARCRPTLPVQDRLAKKLASLSLPPQPGRPTSADRPPGLRPASTSCRRTTTGSRPMARRARPGDDARRPQPTAGERRVPVGHGEWRRGGTLPVGRARSSRRPVAATGAWTATTPTR